MSHKLSKYEPHISKSKDNAIQGDVSYLSPKPSTIRTPNQQCIALTAIENLDELSAGHEGMVVLCPTSIDVMCGAGHEKNYSGNELFKISILQYVEQYSAAQSKKIKMDITKTILDRLNKSGVRFLKKVKADKYWYVVSSKIARDKIGHCLRVRLSKTPKTNQTSSGFEVHQETVVREKQRLVPLLHPHSLNFSCLSMPVKYTEDVAQPCTMLCQPKSMRNLLDSAGLPDEIDDRANRLRAALVCCREDKDMEMIKEEKADVKLVSSASSLPIDTVTLPKNDVEISESIFLKAMKSYPFVDASQHDRTFSGDCQQSQPEKCETRGILDWSLLDNFHQETLQTSLIPSMPVSEGSQPTSKCSEICSLESREWGSLSCASVSSITNINDQFDLDDHQSNCSSVELFDESELALRLGHFSAASL